MGPAIMQLLARMGASGAGRAAAVGTGKLSESLAGLGGRLGAGSMGGKMAMGASKALRPRMVPSAQDAALGAEFGMAAPGTIPALTAGQTGVGLGLAGLGGLALMGGEEEMPAEAGMPDMALASRSGLSPNTLQQVKEVGALLAAAYGIPMDEAYRMAAQRLVGGSIKPQNFM